MELAVQHGLVARADQAQVSFLGIERGVVEAVLKAASPDVPFTSGGPSSQHGPCQHTPCSLTSKQ